MRKLPTIFENISKDKIIKEAYDAANQIVEKAKFDAKMLISEIEILKENNPKLHEVADVKHKVSNLDVKKEEIKGDKNHVYHLGDDVYVPKFDQYGSVLKVNGNKVLVGIGNMQMEFKKEDIIPQSNAVVKSKLVKKMERHDSVKKSSKNIKMTLDLRGMRYEEAKDALNQYLDDLLLTGMKQASIIHGFGTGTIRNLVQDTIKKNSNITSSRYGGEGEGGLGVTVITLK